MHALVPRNLLNLPGTHAEQLYISPSYPKLQSQYVVPPEDTEFAGQTVHAALPGLSLNFPAAHARQGCPFGAVYPALQKHCVIFMLPIDEFAFTGQVVHEPLFTIFLYVPGAHA
jgi:hypothetical protein